MVYAPKKVNVHRESVVDPSEYQHVGEFYSGTSPWIEKSYRDEHDRLAALIGPDWFDQLEFHRNGGCAHCGAHFAYGSVFAHSQFRYVAIGHTCASERFTVDSNLALRAKLAKKRGASAAKNAKIREQFGVQVADTPGLAEALTTDHYIVNDIRSKGEKYGSLSERQIELVFKLQKQVAESAKREEQWAAEKVPIPPEYLYNGRVSIEGVITGAKSQESHFVYGKIEYKMTVKVTVSPGKTFTVYGTLPANLSQENDITHLKGKTVQFVARVEKSDRDDSFGFFKIPKKAVIVD